MDQQLKQRLIGVTIVVALVVIFVPMLFEERDSEGKVLANGIPPIPDEVMEKPLELPKSAADVVSEEEKTDTGSRGYRIIPLTDEAPAKPVESKASRPEPEASAEPPAEEEEFTTSGKSAPAPKKSENTPETKPAAIGVAEKPLPGKPATSAKPPVEPKKRRPQTVQPAPSAAPAKATTPAVKAAETTAQKVDSPEAAQAETEPSDTPPFKAVAPKPMPKPTTVPPVKAAPPAAKASESASSASKAQAADLTAWVVQTGSFTSEAKAKALAEKLRQSRFAAFVERAANDGGFMYRVHVGPELDRSRAEQMQKQIESNMGIKGIILPHP